MENISKHATTVMVTVEGQQVQVLAELGRDRFLSDVVKISFWWTTSESFYHELEIVWEYRRMALGYIERFNEEVATEAVKAILNLKTEDNG